MRKRAYLYARSMVWNRVAQSYVRVFEQARVNRLQPVRAEFSVQAVESIEIGRIASA
jgi:hypothetical protein